MKLSSCKYVHNPQMLRAAYLRIPSFAMIAR